MIDMVESVASFPYTILVLDSYFVEFLFCDEPLTFRTGFLHQIVTCKLRPVCVIFCILKKLAKSVELSDWPGLLLGG